MITLRHILEHKRKEVEQEKKQESIERLKEKIKALPPTRDFLSCISKSEINIIAETKIESPSASAKNRENGTDGSNVSKILKLAREYDRNTGVSAISVLSDKKYFKGSKEVMQEVKKITNKPILRKDFIIDEYQVYQSRAYGADAILLISSALTTDEMRKFVELSRSLGMESLVEFSTEKGKKRIPDNVKIYGRNYRPLELDNDLECPDYAKISDPALIDDLPPKAVKVAESQINTGKDITTLKQKGYNAFLIGTAISFASNTKSKIKELVSQGSL